MGGGFCWDGDEDDEEGEEGGVEGYGRDGGEDLAIAVEEEAEGVDELVGDDHMPCLNDAILGLVNFTMLGAHCTVQVWMSQLIATDQRAAHCKSDAR